MAPAAELQEKLDPFKATVLLRINPLEALIELPD
jgi:hypothetical protein